MGFLNFGKKSNNSQPDPDLEDLTVREAALLRTLFASKWPAAEGAITLHGDYAEGASGAQYGLYNLSRAVKLEPESNWPEVVERHISGLLSRQSAPRDEDLSDDEILSLIKARLIPSAYLPAAQRETFRYRRAIVDGLEVILMLDHPEITSAVPDSIVDRFEAEQLWAAALAAVSTEPIDEIHTLDTGNGAFQAIVSDSMFTASRVLDFPGLLAAAGVASAPHGVLFAVPSRHHVAFHVITGPEAIHVVQDLHGFAQQMFGQGVGEISADVFYWSDAGYEQVTSSDESGRIAVDGTGAFFASINGF
ncbi:hypothetical protein ACIQTX_11130 [Microbacterium sp. NPDC090281]|uniref:hypothetical protein n=1 Tax=Microbacterium sp. NPDC090281 TaxID=3364208 RepID=UPI0038042BCE